jgi:DNA-binding MarR family transcriptional regulator
MTDIVHRIRAFNRFYLPAMNLLGNHYLGSEYSAAEARVLFEIYEAEGCNAARIAETMKIDKSYLSRIIKSHEKKGYIERRPCESDRRSQCLYLTEEGRKRAEDFIRKSDDDIRGIIGDLSPEDEAELRGALDAATRILSRNNKGQQS